MGHDKVQRHNKRPLIILDRDGVINQDSDQFIKSPKEWQPIDGSIDAIARLSQTGFVVAVATNQSGVARELFDVTSLNAMHAKMQALVRAAGGNIDGVFYCPHGPESACECRKPRPGLFHQIAQRFGHELAGVPAIGDSLRDLQAAQSAGAKPILVKSGKGERTLTAGVDIPNLLVYPNLADAVDALLVDHHQSAVSTR